MINKKKNVIKLLTLDPKTVSSDQDQNSMDDQDSDQDSVQSLDTSSHKLISNLPASIALIGKREQAKKLKSSIAAHDDNSSIGSSSLVASLNQLHLYSSPSSFDHNDEDKDLDDASTCMSQLEQRSYNIHKDQYVEQKYFKNNFAKNSLNERIKYLHHVNQDLLPTEDLNLMKSTIFDTPLQKINEFPFAVRRPDIEDHQDEFEDYDLYPEQEQQQEVEQGVAQQDHTDQSIFSTSRRSIPSLTSPPAFAPHRHRQPQSRQQQQQHSSRSSPRSPPRPVSPLQALNSSSLAAFTSSSALFNTSAYSSDINSKLTHLTSQAPTSPRSKYLVGCLRSSLNPRASLILRKHVNDELNLQHLGMGDKMGLVFAESLSELPQVTAINLSDNNLTDKSLSHIIHAVCQMERLISLNLSMNKIDSETCKSLAEFLLSPICALRSLVLHKADIDDFECHMFVAALETNTVSHFPLLCSLTLPAIFLVFPCLPF
jgi:hypothetical protein